MLERKLSAVEVTETKLAVTEKGLSEMEVTRRQEKRFLALVIKVKVMLDWGPKGKFGPPLPAVVIIYAPKEASLTATDYPEIPVA
ncbi:hypothetical protein IGI04_030470 [Brassica rapa subsp. trilocularis]|nr:hypothetical protein IGI04_030470 [Brassica rapa subsp. trilocularis]